jgi:anti-sigma B factor antagonist
MAGTEDLFAAEVVHLDGVARIAMRGELDVYTAPTFRDLAVSLIQQGHHRIVLDARELTFIDSTGIGLIVGAMRRAEGEGGYIRMSGATRQVARSLEVVGLAARLGVTEEITEPPPV